MSRKLFSQKQLICWLLAAVVVLSFQLVSWAEKCTQPNKNQLYLCYTPNPPGVKTCTGLPFSTCGSSKVYNIKNFPTLEYTESGATKQVQDDCYQVTSCTWKVKTGCVNGTTLPSPTAYYQAAKIVDNPDQKCGE